MAEITLNLTKAEIELIWKALCKVTNQTETGEFEKEKYSIDSKEVATSELGSELIQTQYALLLQRIEDAKNQMQS